MAKDGDMDKATGRGERSVEEGITDDGSGASGGEVCIVLCKEML